MSSSPRLVRRLHDNKETGSPNEKSTASSTTSPSNFATLFLLLFAFVMALFVVSVSSPRTLDFINEESPQISSMIHYVNTRHLQVMSSSSSSNRKAKLPPKMIRGGSSDKLSESSRQDRISTKSNHTISEKNTNGGKSQNKTNSKSKGNEKSIPKHSATIPDFSTLEWHWDKYSKSRPKDTVIPSRRLVIVQYTGWEDYYFQMTDISSRANRAYAKMHHVDYVRMNGVAYGSHTGIHAPYNKIFILRHFRERFRHNYDVILLLDSDAVIVDLDFDALELLPPNYLFAAHKIIPGSSNTTWEINNGVTLWNLKHKEYDEVVRRWAWRCKHKMERGLGVSDQGPLHFGLRTDYTDEERAEKGVVWALPTKHLQPRNGTFVTHFIRAMGGLPENWSQKDGTYYLPSQYRIDQIRKSVDRVCQLWPKACDKL